MGAIRLLEREALLGRLAEHAEASRRGAGRLVFVGGEAGAGKTSLVERFRRDLPSDTTVMWGACEAMEAPTPLAPLLDFANELVEDAEELIGWRARRYRLFGSVLASLKASPKPQLLVFEDLHWADEATFDLLRFLSRRVGDARVLLIATYRDDELGPDHGLRRLLGDVAAASTVHRLAVPPLTLTAVRELASELNTDPAALHARTRGNPFYVTEILASGGAGLPEKLGDAIAARVSRLSPAGRRALELASVCLKHELNAGTLSALVPYPEAIDECIARGLLAGAGPELGFRHELVREAVEAAMPLSRRRAAHAAILALLEGDDQTAGAGRDHSVRREVLSALAHHAAEAGDGPATLRYSTAAGKLAMQYQANREARIQFLRAIPLADSLALEARAQLFLDYAKVCCVTGDFAESIEPSLTAITAWREAGRDAKTAQALLLLSAAYVYLGRDAESWRAIDEAEALVEGASPPDASSGGTGRDWELVLSARASIYLERGEACYPDVAGIEAWAARAEACWREQRGRKALAVMQRLQGLAQIARKRYRRALRWFDMSIETAAANDYDDLAAGHITVSALLQSEHRYRLTDARLAQVLELGRNWDAVFTVDRALAFQCVSYLYQGCWPEAEAVAASLLDRPQACVAARVRGLITLGRLRLRRGEARAAEPLEEALDACERFGVSSQLLVAHAALLEQALTSGAPVPAVTRERALQALAGAARTSPPGRIAELAYWLWQAGERTEQPVEAVGDPFALQLRGRAAAAARRWRRLGCPYEEARALVEVDEPESLRRAHALFTGLGARPAAARTLERLRQQGVRNVASRPAADPPGLTPRERQVLTLMRRGLRNAEIAEVNHVSPRTVDHQVSAVLAKLGARTRTEAVSLADHLGITAE